MSASKRPSVTEHIIGALPDITGDRFRPNDYIIDKRSMKGRIGDAISLFTNTPSIVSGCVVTATNDGVADTIDVSAGEVLIYDDTLSSITLHNNDATALPSVPLDKHVVYIPFAGKVAANISNLTKDGATQHYAKLHIDVELVQSRNRAGDAALYDFITEDTVELVVDTVPPTVDEILLSQFTVSAATFFTFNTASRTDPSKTKVLGGILETGGPLKVDDSNTISTYDNNNTSDRTYEFPDRDSRMGAVPDWIANSNYEIDDYVVENGILYRCVTANSDAVFTEAKWQAIGDTTIPKHFIKTTQVVPLDVGCPVYFDGSVWQKAKADNVNTLASGVVRSVNGNDYEIMFGGKLVLTSGQWDIVTGGSGGLTPGTAYYVSETTAGQLVASAPSIASAVLFSLSATDAIVQFRFVGAESGAGNLGDILQPGRSWMTMSGRRRAASSTNPWHPVSVSRVFTQSEAPDFFAELYNENYLEISGVTDWSVISASHGADYGDNVQAVQLASNADSAKFINWLLDQVWFKTYSRVNSDTIAGKGIVIFSADAATNQLTLAGGHRLNTSDAVVVGLSPQTNATLGTTYYARKVSNTIITLHPTFGDAISGANTIDITSTTTIGLDLGSYRADMGLTFPADVGHIPAGTYRIAAINSSSYTIVLQGVNNTAGGSVSGNVRHYINRIPGSATSIKWDAIEDVAIMTPLENGSIANGTMQLDQMQGHWHSAGSNNSGTPSYAFLPGYSENSNDRAKPAAPAQQPITDGINGTPRTGARTRPRNVRWDSYVYVGKNTI